MNGESNFFRKLLLPSKF